MNPDPICAITRDDPEIASICGNFTSVGHRQPDVGLSTLVGLRGLRAASIDFRTAGGTMLREWTARIGNWRCARSLSNIGLAFGRKTLGFRALAAVASRVCD